MPIAQAMQLSGPGAPCPVEKVPAGHELRSQLVADALAPEAVEYSPGAHRAQALVRTLPPGTSPKVPGGHSVHALGALLPGVDPYVPARHGTHTDNAVPPDLIEE